MNIRIVPASYSRSFDLATRLRQSDADEVRAAGNYSPREALITSIRHSDIDMCWCALVDGRPEVMWGAVDAGHDSIGIAWLLGSEMVSQIKRHFWKYSIEYTALMHTRYDILTNYISVQNIPSMTWLSGLGFKPVEVNLEYGYLKQPFIRYESCVTL